MDHHQKLLKIINIPVKRNKIAIDKHQVNYIVSGKGEPLILIHGANAGWGQWYGNIAYFSKFFKVYALDLPGAGESSEINYKKADIVKDYYQTVEKFISLLKLKRVSIIGHSFGGAIAIKLALNKNAHIKKIILVNPMGFSLKIPSKQILVSINLIVELLTRTVMAPNKKNIASFLKSAVFKKEKLREEFIDYYFEQIKKDKNRHPFLFLNSLTKNLKIKNEIYFVNNLSQIRQPVLIILGEKDTMITHTQTMLLHKLIPNIELKVISSTGHLPFIEEDKQFNKLAINFLKQKKLNH